MFADFAGWLSHTWLSEYLKSVSWLVPLSQTVHILAIAAVLAAYLFLSARALGLIARNETMEALKQRFLPWAWIGFAVLFCTGVLQIIAEPERSITNSFFQYKMVALVLVIAITLMLRRKLVAVSVPGASASAVASLLLLVMGLLLFIIFCGRWIAYSAYS